MELNEAFARAGVAVLRELRARRRRARQPNGGAIALAAPRGMSGARLALTAATELPQREARPPSCTMCIGVGQGISVLLRRH